MQPGLAILSLGLVSGAIGLFLYLAARGKARALNSWPTVPCQIVESYVKRTTGHAISEIHPRPSYYVPVVRSVAERPLATQQRRHFGPSACDAKQISGQQARGNHH
jgi:hypothetical protein